MDQSPTLTMPTLVLPDARSSRIELYASVHVVKVAMPQDYSTGFGAFFGVRGILPVFTGLYRHLPGFTDLYRFEMSLFS